MKISDLPSEYHNNKQSTVKIRSKLTLLGFWYLKYTPDVDYL